MGTRVKPEYDDWGIYGDGPYYDGPGTGPSQPLTLSLSKGEGFEHRTRRPSFDKLRMR